MMVSNMVFSSYDLSLMCHCEIISHTAVVENIRASRNDTHKQGWSNSNCPEFF